MITYESFQKRAAPLPICGATASLVVQRASIIFALSPYVTCSYNGVCGIQGAVRTYQVDVELFLIPLATFAIQTDFSN